MTNERACLGFASGLHLALLFWNPVVLRETWKALASIAREPILILDVVSPVTVRREATGLARGGVAALPKSLPSRNFQPFRQPLPPSFNPDNLQAGQPGTIAATVVPFHSANLGTQLLQDRVRIKAFNPIIGNAAGDPSAERGMGSITGTMVPGIPVGEGALQGNGSSRNSDGLSIEGPLADRAVLHRVIPEYPAWAEEQGIMGTVRLRFSVAKDGRVNSFIRIERTSGQDELDRLAIEALRKWRFSPSAESAAQWGIITFTFSLQEKIHSGGSK